jgi:ACS family D-galactonate transporter-like MFS transporter
MREDERLSPALWGVLTLLFLSLFINYIDRGALSIAAPMLKEQFGMSPGKLGVLLSAFFWTYASFLLISGWLADRFDAGRVLAAGFFVWSLATLFTGALPGFAGLFAMRLLLGAGESTAYPCFSNLLVRHFPERQRGFANAFISVGISAGPAFGLLLGALLMGRYGWRPYFIGLGCAGLLWLPLWLAKMPRMALPHGTAQREEAEAGPRMMDILRQRSAWGTFLGMFGGNYLLYCLLTWLPYYLVRERHFSLERMGRIGALAYLLMAIVSVVSGAASDRWIAAGRSATLVRKSMIGTGQLAGGIFLVACATAAPELAVAFLLMASAAFGLNASNVWVITQTLAGPQAAGRWTGLQNFVGNLAGVAAPAVTGFAVERTGNFVWAFVITGVISMLGAASWVFVLGRIEPVQWGTTGARRTRPFLG